MLCVTALRETNGVLTIIFVNCLLYVCLCVLKHFISEFIKYSIRFNSIQNSLNKRDSKRRWKNVIEIQKSKNKNESSKILRRDKSIHIYMRSSRVMLWWCEPMGETLFYPFNIQQYLNTRSHTHTHTRPEISRRFSRWLMQLTRFILRVAQPNSFESRFQSNGKNVHNKFNSDDNRQTT